MWPTSLIKWDNQAILLEERRDHPLRYFFIVSHAQQRDERQTAQHDEVGGTAQTHSIASLGHAADLDPADIGLKTLGEAVDLAGLIMQHHQSSPMRKHDRSINTVQHASNNNIDSINDEQGSRDVSWPQLPDLYDLVLLYPRHRACARPRPSPTCGATIRRN